MALNTFTPQIWAATLLDNLNDAHVYANVVNRDYEGEIKSFGDTVRINTPGRVTVSAYTKNTWNLTPEVLDGTGQTLVIDQANYFDFAIDDIDAAQNKPSVMNAYMKEAAWGIADVADVFIATTISGSIATANQLGSKTVGTGAGNVDAYELLVDINTALTKTNTPKNDRWAVVDPNYVGMLLKDPRFTSFGTGENLGRAMSGDMFEKLVGFRLYVSNNVPVTNDVYTILAGYKGAVTYAEQIPLGQPEAFRPEGGFADAVKGLHLSGAKVTRPSNLVSVEVTYA